MKEHEIAQIIASGQTCLGIEFGSTRVKAVLIGTDHTPIASGSFSWENLYENGIWTYHTEDIWLALQSAYAAMAADVQSRYFVTLRRVASMGLSAMMHGYLALDRTGTLLMPYRTWRNTTTGTAAEALTEAFRFNIPQRWSIAHLYQAILSGEDTVKDIDYLTTLSGYVHFMLTGQRVLGIGDASGMFPINSFSADYDEGMIEKFHTLTADRKYPWKLWDILPRVLKAGEPAGSLSTSGAALIDPTGTLEPGIPLCPPEGDAGTGMVSTNAVAERTGNVSAGTSVFAMLVLERPLSKIYREIDIVTTPTGKPVAMVHCNNCTNEINAWAGVFQNFLEAMGQKADMDDIFAVMFRAAMDGKADGGGLVLYNYLSGEPVVGLNEGRPLLVRRAEAELTFSNFMRTQLIAALVSLRLGMNILEREQVTIDRLLGHGGYFKTPKAGQRMLAAAIGVPVSCMATADEGGPWGMALLAAYQVRKTGCQSLEDYLENCVFAGREVMTLEPDAADAKGFEAYTERFVQGMPVEIAAVTNMK